MTFSEKEDEFKEVAKIFAKVKGFKDADDLADKCLEMAENIRKSTIYDTATNKMNSAKTESDYKAAAGIFAKVKGFKDSEKLEEQCIIKAKDIVYNNAKRDLRYLRYHETLEGIKKLGEIKGFKDSDELVEYYNNLLNRVENILERYKNVVIHRESWVRKLFGVKDRKEYEQCVEVFKKPIENITMMESLCNEMTLDEAALYLDMINWGKRGGQKCRRLGCIDEWLLPTEAELVILQKKKKLQPDCKYWSSSDINKNQDDKSVKKHFCCINKSIYFLKWFGTTNGLLGPADCYLELVYPVGKIRMIYMEGRQPWKDAMQSAKNLRIGGFSDWRVATIKNLKIIYKNKEVWGLGSNLHGLFWSSSSSIGINRVWCVQFGIKNGFYTDDGIIISTDKKDNGVRQVLYVR